MTDTKIPEGYKLVPISQNGELTEQVAVRMSPETFDLVERLSSTFDPPYPRGATIRWVLELSLIEDLVRARESAKEVARDE